MFEIDKDKAEKKAARAKKIANRVSERPLIRSAFLARFVLGVVGALKATAGVFMIYVQAVEHFVGVLFLSMLWISAATTFLVAIFSSDKTIRNYANYFFKHF